MNSEELVALVDRLRSEPAENEWLEFKERSVQPDKLGEYISALSNSAALAMQQYAYLVLGVRDKTHEVVSTQYNIHTETHKKQNLLLWTLNGLSPRIHVTPYDVHHPDGRVVLFEIGAAPGQPVKFYGNGYIRIGESKTPLANHPAKEAALWHINVDWSSEVVSDASLADLDAVAVQKAREEYIEKNPNRHEEISNWSTETFLNKVKVLRQGKITRAALILLGTPESSALLSPGVARMSWFLKDDDNNNLDYEHFEPPFILQVDALLTHIRNLTLRTLPGGTLFPNEVQQYDLYVLREALHNAIAHQDYGLQGRVQIVETPSQLLITNVGNFLPGSVERVIQQDAPEEIYRNPFLAEAMVNLNMIDTQGGGIRRMFLKQRERFLPLPDYDLKELNRVKVTIPGKILDEQYSRLLMERADLSLWQVLLLDKVQKGQAIPHEAHKRLKAQRLVEGRYPNTILSSSVARATGRKAEHIRARGFDNQYYRDFVLELIREHGPVSRKDIDALLIDKLPEALTQKQKHNKVHNILRSLVKSGDIENEGSRRHSLWVVR